MKRFLIICLFGGMLTACSGDDGGDGGMTDENTESHFPITANSYWNYTNVDAVGEITSDSLFVLSAASSGDVTTLNLGVDPIPANGFMTGLLSNSEVRITETQMIIDGTLAAPVEGFEDIEIPYADIILYDMLGGAENEEYSRQEGSFEQNINNIPLEVDYVLTTNHLETAVVDDPNGGTNRKPTTSLTLNLKVTAKILIGGLEIPVPVLSAQDVVVVTNTYEEGIGLVDSQVAVNFELEDLSDFGIDFPFPLEQMANSSQEIADYQIEE